MTSRGKLRQFHYRYWGNISSFNRLQIVIGILAISAASYFAFQQTEINRQILDLTAFPSLEVALGKDSDTGDKVIYLTNKGKYPISFWGSYFELEEKTIRDEGQVIAQGARYSLPLVKSVWKQVFDIIRKEGEKTYKNEFFLKTLNGKRYVVLYYYNYKIIDDKEIFNLQPGAIYESNWE